FEFPKEISLSELAKKLGVAKSTASEILRKGEAKVLHSYFHGLMRRGR
ncbi:MAG: helix-turn-helix domain-containing protein, partial [Thermoplasmata archaeon]